MINKLIDLEKDLRLAEKFLRNGFFGNGAPRNMNCCKDELWFSLMEEQGFLIGNVFLPIIDIIYKTKDMKAELRVFTLESVGCDLSKIASLI
jgi:hypothetical protein